MLTIQQCHAARDLAIKHDIEWEFGKNISNPTIRFYIVGMWQECHCWNDITHHLGYQVGETFNPLWRKPAEPSNSASRTVMQFMDMIAFGSKEEIVKANTYLSDIRHDHAYSAAKRAIAKQLQVLTRKQLKDFG